MKLYFQIVFFVCLFSNLSLFAQEEEELAVVAKDTVGYTIDPLAPSKAAFYSALVPGLGQAYNKKYWKIPLVYIGIGAGVYYYTWNNNKYHEVRDEYKRRLDGTNDPNHPKYGSNFISDDRILRAQKSYQQNRDLSALIAAGFYILNIVDANVDAHLMQFNVNDNLSVAPDVRQNQIDYKFNTGLKLTYNF